MLFAQSVRERLNLGVAGQIEVGRNVGGQNVDAGQEFFDGQIGPHGRPHGAAWLTPGQGLHRMRTGHPTALLVTSGLPPSHSC